VDPFPNGWWHYLAGGLLVGAGTAAIFLLTGLRAGASSVFSTSWSWFSRLDYFQRSGHVGSRVWRVVFSLGLLAGAALFAARSDLDFVTEVQPWRLLVGGLFVGFGTRLSQGCTSGHGICGISAGSKPSILAVLTFMGVAIVVAHVVRALGVTP